MNPVVIKYLQCDVNVFQFHLNVQFPEPVMKRKTQSPMSVCDFSITNKHKYKGVKERVYNSSIMTKFSI